MVATCITLFEVILHGSYMSIIPQHVSGEGVVRRNGRSSKSEDVFGESPFLLCPLKDFPRTSSGVLRADFKGAEKKGSDSPKNTLLGRPFLWKGGQTPLSTPFGQKAADVWKKDVWDFQAKFETTSDTISS